METSMPNLMQCLRGGLESHTGTLPHINRSMALEPVLAPVSQKKRAAPAKQAHGSHTYSHAKAQSSHAALSHSHSHAKAQPQTQVVAHVLAPQSRPSHPRLDSSQPVETIDLIHRGVSVSQPGSASQSPRHIGGGSISAREKRGSTGLLREGSQDKHTDGSPRGEKLSKHTSSGFQPTPLQRSRFRQQFEKLARESLKHKVSSPKNK
eukprot:Rmarinus@m.29509